MLTAILFLNKKGYIDMRAHHLEARNNQAPKTNDYTKPHVHCPGDVFAHPNKALNPARVESSSKRTAKCLSNIQGVTLN